VIDILERIDGHLLDDDAERRHWNADALLEDAAVEIEQLRERLERWKDIHLEKERLTLEVELLKKTIKKANAANSRLAQYNHEISKVNKELMDEIASARAEIRDMNVRIDWLRQSP